MRLLMIGAFSTEKGSLVKELMSAGAVVTEASTLAEGIRCLTLQLPQKEGRGKGRMSSSKSSENVPAEIFPEVLSSFPFDAVIIEDSFLPFPPQLIRCLLPFPVVILGPKAFLFRQCVEASSSGSSSSHSLLGSLNVVDCRPFPLPPEWSRELIHQLSRPQKSFVSRDVSMYRLIQMADKIASTEASVLITGESGTGKEVMARYLHENSHRRHYPFVAVNCAAIPESLLESELFGHEKGAFTGAIERRMGKFEEAHRGTLLLDEVTEMHPHLQAKLLRAIQERLIDRVGSSKSIPVDIRILATSNREMDQACREGIFREDLYYRLNVIHLALPPLRERPGDLESLALSFVNQFCQMNKKPFIRLSKEALQGMKAYHWPGNIRELENRIHRGVLLSEGEELTLKDLFEEDSLASLPLARSPECSSDLLSISPSQTIAQAEQDLILGTLVQCQGNKTHAATLLGISLRTLRNKLNQYGQGDPSLYASS